MAVYCTFLKPQKMIPGARPAIEICGRTRLYTFIFRRHTQVLLDYIRCFSDVTHVLLETGRT
jgi:hypothetical protein